MAAAVGGLYCSLCSSASLAAAGRRPCCFAAAATRRPSSLAAPTAGPAPGGGRQQAPSAAVPHHRSSLAAAGDCPNRIRSCGAPSPPSVASPPAGSVHGGSRLTAGLLALLRWPATTPPSRRQAALRVSISAVVPRHHSSLAAARCQLYLLSVVAPGHLSSLPVPAAAVVHGGRRWPAVLLFVAWQHAALPSWWQGRPFSSVAVSGDEPRCFSCCCALPAPLPGGDGSGAGALGATMPDRRSFLVTAGGRPRRRAAAQHTPSTFAFQNWQCVATVAQPKRSPDTRI